MIALLIQFAVLIVVLVLVRWVVQTIVGMTAAPPVILMVFDILLVLVFAIVLINLTIGLTGVSPVGVW